jgi:redox-sensitive bicupin YhaK (pirin superfamily)
MITVRPSRQRGHANHGWLDSFHSFSFADYYDAEFMGYGPLRVINEDRVQPGMGFGTHGHRDMEIISYVLDGQLSHQDNMGNGSIITPGDVQRMSAGRGVMHSESNPSPTEGVHFLQIWIEPSVRGIPASYEQSRVTADARIYATLLDGSESVTRPIAPGRRAYVHVARGSVKVNGVALAAGDAARIEDDAQVTLAEGAGAEVLLFDLN